MRYRKAPTGEPGFVDLASANYACNTTGSITHVNIIPQGSSVNQRIGKKCHLDYIHVRGLLSADTATTATKASLILVYDKRPVAAVPAITEYLNTISSNSFLLDANRDRFITLWRKDYIVIGNITTPTVGKEYFDIDTVVRVNKQEIFKAVGDGAMGDIETGAVYLITVGNTAAGTGDANATLGFRTVFHDV